VGDIGLVLGDGGVILKIAEMWMKIFDGQCSELCRKACLLLSKPLGAKMFDLRPRP